MDYTIYLFLSLAALGAILFLPLLVLAGVGLYHLCRVVLFWNKEKQLARSGFLTEKQAVLDWRIEALSEGGYAVAPPDTQVMTEHGPRWRPTGTFIVPDEEIDTVYKQVQQHREAQLERIELEKRLEGTEIYQRFARNR